MGIATAKGARRTLRADRRPVKAALPPTAAGRGLLDRLFSPVDASSLAVFRIAFGALMCWEVLRYFRFGWVHSYFIEPPMHFKYIGFEWLQPWPGDGMYVHFAFMALMAAFVALGLWYRVSAVLFFLAYAYYFLLDQALYLNHFYLIALLSFLMALLPAHRAFSVDAWRRPSIRSDTAPAWAVWTLRAQLGIVYFFGGVAKLNGDWLRGQPMGMWLADATDFPLVGRFFTEEWARYFFSYGGLLLDLLAVPLLLWPRTRYLAFLALVGFHLTNSQLFSIGIFPWLMIPATTIFLSPDWPRRLLRRWVPALARTGRAAAQALPAERSQYVLLGILGLYFAVQLLMPLRHHLYPGDVRWTTEGHRFSWMMKLNDKRAEDVRFSVTGPPRADGRQAVLPPSPNSRQARKMTTRPDLILQYAYYLADELRKQGFDEVQVRAQSLVSLNGRPHQPLVDTAVDLAAEPRSFLPRDWILPLREPLP